MHDLRVILGRSNVALGESIARTLGVKPTAVSLSNFADGEIWVQVMENVRGKDVFIIESTVPPAENILELLLLLDAAKRASARRVTAVIPYFGYARQERKDKPRVPVSAKLVSNLIVAAGADRVLTLDLHSPAIQGFFDVPTDHLTSDLVFIEFLKEQLPEQLKNGEIVIVSPDVGGVKRVELPADELHSSIAIIYKRRDMPNKSRALNLIGSVEGKIAIVRDDIVDTAGTICTAAELLKNNGATMVCVLATHALLSPPAVERIGNSQIDFIAVTDSLAISPVAREILMPDKLKIVSVAGVFATAIKCIHQERSLSVLFQPGAHPALACGT